MAAPATALRMTTSQGGVCRARSSRCGRRSSRRAAAIETFLTLIHFRLAEDTAQGRHCGTKFIDRRAARFLLTPVAEHEFMRDVGGKLGSGQGGVASAALPLVCNSSAARAGVIAIEQVCNFVERQPQLGHGCLPPWLG